MTNDAQDYDIATIRQLLLAAFTPEELRRFCYDRPTFRPVVNRFGRPYRLDDMADELITYCENYLLFPELLTELKQHNPRQYARLERKLQPEVVAAPLDDPQVYLDGGKACRAQGNLAGAIEEYTRAIALDPEYATAYNNRGNARFDQGDFAGAIADYDRAIALNPEYATAYNNRGNARSDQGDVVGAIEDYDRAIALTPEDATAYYNRGNARSDQGDVAGAIADYDQAVALNPADAAAYLKRGVARYAQKDLERAADDFGHALMLARETGDSNNEACAWWGVAAICDTTGKTEDAIAYCQLAIQCFEASEGSRPEALLSHRNELLKKRQKKRPSRTRRFSRWSTSRPKKKRARRR